MKSREIYSVEMDSRGHIVIPAAIRKSQGFGTHSLFSLKVQGSELHLIPSEVREKRELREYSASEVAQTLVDIARSPEEIAASHKAIWKLGLDPNDFSANL